MKVQLNILKDAQRNIQNDDEMIKKQTAAEFHQFLRRKNILEAKIFKKKYERIAKHISGIPKFDRGLSPFTAPYKPSVFSESV
jgi:hypothetical protein